MNVQSGGWIRERVCQTECVATPSCRQFCPPGLKKTFKYGPQGFATGFECNQ